MQKPMLISSCRVCFLLCLNDIQEAWFIHFLTMDAMNKMYFIWAAFQNITEWSKTDVWSNNVCMKNEFYQLEKGMSYIKIHSLRKALRDCTKMIWVVREAEPDVFFINNKAVTSTINVVSVQFASPLSKPLYFLPQPPFCSCMIQKKRTHTNTHDDLKLSADNVCKWSRRQPDFSHRGFFFFFLMKQG